MKKFVDKKGPEFKAENQTTLLWTMIYRTFQCKGRCYQ